MALVAFSAYDRLERSNSNEDPLGFFAYATRLAEEWLPGLTTRTRRIRYYTMICGGLYLIEDEFKDAVRVAPNRDAEIMRLFLRWERLWAVWNGAMQSGGSGMIGRNKVADLFKDDVFERRSIDYPFIQRQADLGALGSYKSSLGAWGLLRDDRLELTYDGRLLGEMFWNNGGNRRAWNHSVQSLTTGRLVFPPRRRRLAEYGERFGLDRDLPKEEKLLLRGKLTPACDADNRRARLLSYLRKNGLGRFDEYEILARIARRGRSRRSEALERCAAAIIALEDFRGSTLALLNEFRDHLYKVGHPDTPNFPSGTRLGQLSGRVNETHRAIMGFVRSAEFVQLFRDFHMAGSKNGQNAASWLRDLLEIHKVEMAKRRSPRWFLPAGGEKWTLDISVAGPPSSNDDLAPYNYRTGNLLRMAREAGIRI